MPKIKKIKLQNTEYDLYDAKALHSGDSGTANITVSKATNADNATNAVNATNAENATNATTASKIGTSTVGGTTQPVYINNGVPTKLSYTIGKSVPSDAVFTDTITTNVIVSATQPTGQRTGDFWYKTV